MVKQAMKKMGVKEEQIDATEVIIKTPEKNFIIRNPHVSKVEMMGQESFQISGDVEVASAVNEEDIRTIMEQANCSEGEAREALERAHGDLAKAILDLQE